MIERLSNAALDKLPATVGRARYDRSALRPGVVHIGLGAFHRAHQAPLFDALAEAGDLRWGVIGASLRSPAVRNMLLPQDCLYSLTVEEDGRRAVSVVSAILDVVVAPEAPRMLVEAIASPETRLVTVTVTEKGYEIDRRSGESIEGNLDLPADPAGFASPVTMADYVAAGLQLRRQEGLAGISIISCDNLSFNGRKLRASVLKVARAHDFALADWIENDCAFPNTMVDRIVPAIGKDDIERVTNDLGVTDCAAVVTEPFSQWIIENRFAGEQPDFAGAGVQFTHDVAPWEDAKLKLLNGAHSAMAYLGGLAGIKTVNQFVSEPWGSAFVGLLWDELEETLHAPAGLDLGEYRATLMRRFQNPAISHQLVQIAVDGSQKIPQRLVPAATAIRNHNRRAEAIALAIAAWVRWQAGYDDHGEPCLVDDPLASTTERLLERARDPLDQVRAIFSLRSVFPESLAADSRFRSSVAEHLGRLVRSGARATVEQFVAQHHVSCERQAQK